MESLKRLETSTGKLVDLTKRREKEPPRWNSGAKVDHAKKDKAYLLTEVQEADAAKKALPPTEKEQWEERLEKWNKRHAYKDLAASVLKGRSLEEQEGMTAKTMREAEAVADAMKSYASSVASKKGTDEEPMEGFAAAFARTNKYKELTDPEAAPAPAGTGGAVSAGAISMQDVLRIKEESRARAAAASLLQFAVKKGATEIKEDSDLGPESTLAAAAFSVDNLTQKRDANGNYTGNTMTYEDHKALRLQRPTALDDRLTFLTSTREEDGGGGGGGESKTSSAEKKPRPRSANASIRKATTTANAPKLHSVERHQASLAKKQAAAELLQREAEERTRFKALPMPGSVAFGPSQTSRPNSVPSHSRSHGQNGYNNHSSLNVVSNIHSTRGAGQQYAPQPQYQQQQQHLPQYPPQPFVPQSASSVLASLASRDQGHRPSLRDSLDAATGGFVPSSVTGGGGGGGAAAAMDGDVRHEPSGWQASSIYSPPPAPAIAPAPASISARQLSAGSNPSDIRSRLAQLEAEILREQQDGGDGGGFLGDEDSMSSPAGTPLYENIDRMYTEGQRTQADALDVAIKNIETMADGGHAEARRSVESMPYHHQLPQQQPYQHPPQPQFQSYLPPQTQTQEAGLGFGGARLEEDSVFTGLQGQAAGGVGGAALSDSAQLAPLPAAASTAGTTTKKVRSAMLLRQKQWVAKREEKVLQLAMEDAERRMAALQPAPDVKSAQDSWERTKKLHAAKLEQQQREEEEREEKKLEKAAAVVENLKSLEHRRAAAAPVPAPHAAVAAAAGWAGTFDPNTVGGAGAGAKAQSRIKPPRRPRAAAAASGASAETTALFKQAVSNRGSAARVAGADDNLSDEEEEEEEPEEPVVSQRAREREAFVNRTSGYVLGGGYGGGIGPPSIRAQLEAAAAALSNEGQEQEQEEEEEEEEEEGPEIESEQEQDDVCDAGSTGRGRGGGGDSADRGYEFDQHRPASSSSRPTSASSTRAGGRAAAGGSVVVQQKVAAPLIMGEMDVLDLFDGDGSLVIEAGKGVFRTAAAADIGSNADVEGTSGKKVKKKLKKKKATPASASAAATAEDPKATWMARELRHRKAREAVQAAKGPRGGSWGDGPGTSANTADTGGTGTGAAGAGAGVRRASSATTARASSLVRNTARVARAPVNDASLAKMRQQNKELHQQVKMIEQQEQQAAAAAAGGGGRREVDGQREAAEEQEEGEEKEESEEEGEEEGEEVEMTNDAGVDAADSKVFYLSDDSDGERAPASPLRASSVTAPLTLHSPQRSPVRPKNITTTPTRQSNSSTSESGARESRCGSLSPRKAAAAALAAAAAESTTYSQDAAIARSSAKSASAGTRTDKSMEVEELERILSGGTGAGRPQSKALPREWPDSLDGAPDGAPAAPTEPGTGAGTGTGTESTTAVEYSTAYSTADRLRDEAHRPGAMNGSVAAAGYQRYRASREVHRQAAGPLTPPKPAAASTGSGSGGGYVPSTTPTQYTPTSQASRSSPALTTPVTYTSTHTPASARSGNYRPTTEFSPAGDPNASFFDPSSTTDKGRHRLHDARDFDTESLHRRPDILNEYVTLLCGSRRGASGSSSVQRAKKEEIITVLFDRSEFSERAAREWWFENKQRLL